MKKLFRIYPILPLVLVFLLSACQQPVDQEETHFDEVKKTEEVEKVTDDESNEHSQLNSLTEKDSSYLDSLINELNGIDQFFVKNSYKRLLAILEEKEDQNVSKVNEILQKVSINEPEYYIEKYLPRNGYIAYTPGPVEVFVEMVYWNKSDGSQLIATQSRSCGPVCDMEISFESYKDGSYEKKNGVIPDQIMLSEKLVPGSTTDDSEPYEFYFKFPIEGKDLQYCIGEACLTLEWSDGVFVLKE